MKTLCGEHQLRMPNGAVRYGVWHQHRYKTHIRPLPQLSKKKGGFIPYV
jgi:hypothetical protein